MSKCKYCGFVGTNDEMMQHAGECEIMLKDYQPLSTEEKREHMKDKLLPADIEKLFREETGNDLICPGIDIYRVNFIDWLKTNLCKAWNTRQPEKVKPNLKKITCNSCNGEGGHTNCPDCNKDG
jgi:hypothetical protein